MKLRVGTCGVDFPRITRASVLVRLFRFEESWKGNIVEESARGRNKLD
jgi:hypothetical protein